jgi:hypothetical protein
MSATPSSDSFSQVGAALLSIASKPDAESKLRIYSVMLAGLAGLAPTKGSPMFHGASAGTCAKELWQTASQAQRLTKEIITPKARRGVARRLSETMTELHKPTILALADSGMFGAGRQSISTIAERIARTGERPTQSETRLLQRMSICAAGATVTQPRLEPMRGRHVNNYVMGVTRIAASAYRELTGRSPTRTVRSDKLCSRVEGQFVSLLRAIYRALGVKASAEAYSRAVIAEERALRPMAEPAKI